MKVGDRLYCYCLTNGINVINYGFTVGKFYTIIYFQDTIAGVMIYITTDFDNRNDWYYIFYNSYHKNERNWHYGNWFYNESELRKIKLNRLNVDTL